MLVGVERAVTRWYARRQVLQDEIVAQQTRLAELRTSSQDATELAEAEQQFTATQARLLDLGHCPRPMMG